MSIKFDKEKIAVINPDDTCKIKKLDNKNTYKIAISCFSFRTFERIVKELNAKELENFELSNANGSFKVYKATYNDIEILLFMSLVGAPGCVAQLEELRVLGIEKYIIFGTCGVLDKNINDLSIIIPNLAVREEGVSYHYKEESNEISVNKKYINEFVEILEDKNIDYTIGKVWTTDAFYRETPKKS